MNWLADWLSYSAMTSAAHGGAPRRRRTAGDSGGGRAGLGRRVRVHTVVQARGGPAGGGGGRRYCDSPMLFIGAACGAVFRGRSALSGSSAMPSLAAKSASA